MAGCLLTSCLGSDNDNAGFVSVSATNAVFANTTRGYIAFGSYGDWRIDQTQGADWCTPTLLSGKGNSMYIVPVDYKTNATGSERIAMVRLQDTGEQDAYVTIAMGQYATRGDGSLGCSPLVRRITGDDGSEMTMDYDDRSRVTSFKLVAGDVERALFVAYPGDTLMTVNDSRCGSLSGQIDYGYQPQELLSSTDTVAYTVAKGDKVTNSYLYSVRQGSKTGEWRENVIQMKELRTTYDTQAKFDSIAYIHQDAAGVKTVTGLRLKLSETDNRWQTVDVNQLLLGAKECDPYLLLGLFRMSRCGYVIAEAKSAEGVYTVSTQTGSDKSVREMTVTRPDGSKTTYKFEY